LYSKNQKLIKSLSIFLTLLFLALSALPSVLAFADDNSEQIHLSSKSNEEENLNEKLLDIEVLFSEQNLESLNPMFKLAEESLVYNDKNYPVPCLNILSPPPDSHHS
jgi:hypothetical protein